MVGHLDMVSEDKVSRHLLEEKNMHETDSKEDLLVFRGLHVDTRMYQPVEAVGERGCFHQDNTHAIMARATIFPWV